MLLSAVLKATRNSSPMAVAAKGAYMGDDLARFARRHGICFKPNPFAFRFNTLRIMHGAVASRRLGVFERYHGAIFDAVWSQRRDLGDDAAPTFFVGEEMFWGNDRLDFVESALEGSARNCGASRGWYRARTPAKRLRRSAGSPP
jgi:2-hydroxychromene-2-carboxylate isomerase